MNNLIFNANHFDVSNISNAAGHGFAFLNWYTCSKSTTLINLNDDTNNHQGFHLRTYYQVDQAIVSDNFNKKYYQNDGMYFIEIMTSDTKDCGGQMVVRPTFQVDFS